MNMMIFKKTGYACGFMAAAMISFMPMQAGAKDKGKKTFVSEYKISLHGLPIAHLNFNTVVNGEKYRISGNLNSSALVNIVEETSGTTSVVGQMGEKSLEAQKYAVKYTSGKKKRSFNVLYDGAGGVEETKVKPKPKRRPKDWVELKETDLTSVVDPISSLTLPLNGPACGRTIKVFDGETLVELKLTHKGYRPFNTEGYSGKATICGVKFTPLGGYRANHESVKFLQQSKDMEVGFVENKMLKSYIPVFAKIPTKVGLLRVWAHKING